jgi:hypothetical protein
MKSKLIFISFTLYCSTLFAQQGSCDPLWQSCTNEQLQIQIMQQQLKEMQDANNLQRQILRQQKKNQQQLEDFQFEQSFPKPIPIVPRNFSDCLSLPLGTRGC